MRAFARSTSFAAAAWLLASCGGNNPAGPGPQGTITVTATGAVSVTIGGTGTVGITIGRGGGFAGAVTLAVTGLPTGVSGAFAPASVDPTTTSSTLNLTAGAGASPGTATLTITASASGVTSQTTTVVLTIIQPTIALALNPTSISVAAGQTGTSTVTITRSTGFSGAVTLVLDAPPAGITGSFNASPTTAGTSTLTISVGSNVTAGSYNVTVKGSATGAQDKTVVLAVTVTAAGPVGFTIAVDPVEFELPAGQGWVGNGIVSIQRQNGFTGAVTVAVQGLGFPATAVPSPATIAPGQTATNLLSLAVDGAPIGLYTGTVRVSAPGFATQTAQVKVRVSAPSTGAITWSFCRGDRVPRYLAIRDGNGPWKHIVPDGPFGATAATPAKYSFDLSQSTASVAIVWLGEKTSGTALIEGHYWNVYYLSRQEMLDLAASECVSNRDVTTRQASGSVTGYQSFDALVASVGRRGLAGVGSTGPLNTTLTMQNLPNGPFDLLLTRTNFTGAGPDPTVQSFVLRRGIDPAAGGTIAAIDFASEGVAPATAPLTFSNASGETVTNTMTFLTADGLVGWMAVAGAFSQTSRTWFGIPANKLLATDLHQITATTGNTAARRQLIHFAHAVGARTLGFGPPLGAPNVSTDPGSPWLVRVTGNLAADYAARLSIYYREQTADPRTMTIVASRGFLGAGTQYDVAIPDLSGLPGFTAFWNVRRGATVKWTVTGGEGSTGDLLVDASCLLTGYCPVKAVDGATYLSAQATGQITIP
jgi:hypothetical protein